MATIKTIKIHPAIGIARLGNSPDGYFIGPELPDAKRRPTGGYKDPQGRVKRQAARFRLFGYDAKGKMVREITAKEANISWIVHLANKKAAWKEFNGLDRNTPLRNKGVDRARLIIDPGPRSLPGPRSSAAFDTGTFLGTKVPLGEMRTDAVGRLLVLGASGTSASVPPHAPITGYANNDRWHDDASDGPVSATVELKADGRTLNAVGAWVICAPPDFAPSISNIITLYDTLQQVAVDRVGLKLPHKLSFTRDIHPILERTVNMMWVNKMNAMGHAHVRWDLVLQPPGDITWRTAIFNKLRDPRAPGGEPTEGSDMPMLWSDYYPAEGNEPLTRTQYHILKQWKNGHFINDWAGRPRASRKITPEGLDRAALEACIGGAFYPGIEASWMVRDEYAFLEPFRLDPGPLSAGDVTKQMAVPWQADFYDCKEEKMSEGEDRLAWWPAQRPDDVIPEGGTEQVPWVRVLVGSMEGMIAKWHKLGFVIKKGSKYVETERG